MIYLTAGLVLVGAVTVLNLLLTLAVIRRLRKHEEERRQNFVPLDSGPETGAPLPAFTAVTVGGEPVSAEALTGRQAALTFLSTDCSACVTAVKDLPEFARRTGMDAAQMLVVIAGDTADARRMAEPLAGIATVVVEETGGPLSALYSIRATPTTVMTDPDGTVTYAQAGTNPVLEGLPA
ncbi:TlpA family protein disulfide reductase [Streptomyces sp. NPDC013181]|uniref:TlpA family protein disulfide reductase n=1 Tax=Streptomyces sp. NPDC013181 TaxID=3364864 RepID=UPI00369B3285